MPRRIFTQDVALKKHYKGSPYTPELVGLSMPAYNICCRQSILTKAKLKEQILNQSLHTRKIRWLSQDKLNELRLHVGLPVQLERPTPKCPHCGELIRVVTNTRLTK